MSTAIFLFSFAVLRCANHTGQLEHQQHSHARTAHIFSSHFIFAAREHRIDSIEIIQWQINNITHIHMLYTIKQALEATTHRYLFRERKR